MSGVGSSSSPPGAGGGGASRAANLSISVLGGIGLSYGGREVRLANRKARALLAYLAMSETASERRERLAGLLWGDSTEQNARTSLRQVLFELRETLDPLGCTAIAADRQDVGLAPSTIDLDIASILRELAQGEVSEHLLAQPRIADTLLAGYDDLSPMFKEWVTATRRAVHDRLMRALEQGYDNQGLQRRQRRRMAEAALLLDPTHEAACRAAMRLAAEDGETGAALRAYAALYAALGEEVDMEPSAPTQELLVQVKQGRFDTPSPPAMAPAAAPAMQSRTVAVPVARVTLALAGAPTVAVLPFLQFGDADVPSHLSNGLVADIVSQLAGLRDLSVISHGSTINLTDPSLDLREVGQRLGAHYLVRGAMRRAGADIRLTAELTEAETGRIAWARSADMHGVPSFADQDRIVRQVVSTLAPRVQELELHRIRGQRPESLTAYDKVLLAREFMGTLQRDAFIEARQLLDQVIVTEPSYAEGYALAADWHGLMIGQGWSGDRARDVDDAERLARKALSLDQDNVRALVLYGHRRSLWHRDYQDAQALFARALDAAPSSAHAWRWSSFTYAYIGNAAEAVARATRALELSPCDRDLHSFYLALCVAHYTAGQYEQAADWGKRSLAATPALRSSAGWVAASLAALGRQREAQEIAAHTMADWPERRVRDVVAHHPYADEARRRAYGRHLVEAGFPE